MHRPTSLSALVLPALWLCACATTPEVQGPPPTPPEERSSLDVLLRHRDALQLTPKQADTIELADSQRETLARTVRDQFEAQRGQKPEDGPAGPSGMGFGGANGGAPVGGMNPNLAPGPSGMAPSPGMGRKRAGPTLEERLHQRLDELDTLAFVEVSERVLTDEQRPKAEKLVTGYRTRLAEYRQAVSRQRRR